jgi:CSLREA domain-containing protein
MFRFVRRIGILLLLGVCAPCIATTITVNTEADQFGSDTAHCSLREAIQAANTNLAFGGCAAGSGTDIVNLHAGTFTLSRSGRDEDANATGDLDIASSVVILGESAETTIIDANAIDRVFHIRGGSAVSFIDATIRNGDAMGTDADSQAGGGGIWGQTDASLSLLSVHMTGNRAFNGGGVLASNGTSAVTIGSSTFSHNRAESIGGGLYSVRKFRLTNSTISANLAACAASAIYLGSFANDSLFESSTIVENQGFDCGGTVYPAIYAGQQDTVPHAHDTIIARNLAGSAESNCNRLQSDDYNLLGDVEDCELGGTMTHTLTGFDPKVAPLFDYGGTTPTHALLPGSPAIGAGGDCPGSDQRGVTRAACDIGAYAYKPTFVVNQIHDALDADPNDGLCKTATNQCSLRAAVEQARTRDDPTLIILPAGTFPLTIARVGDNPEHTGQLLSTALDSLTIFGAGAGNTQVVGVGSEDVIFQFMTGAHAIARLSVSGGDQNTVITAGGIATYHAPLLLSEVEIAHNHGCNGGLSIGRLGILDRVSIHDNLADRSGCPSSTGGGIQVSSGAELFARNVTISGNRSRDGGGGLNVDGGIARLVHVTIADNTAGYSGANADGGGLHRGSTGTIYLKNSIVAHNTAPGSGDDCAAIVQSQDYNLIGDASACTIGGETGGNLVGADPLLDALVDDGDGLPVRGLKAASPAIDAVGNASNRISACTDANAIYTILDQRGMPRPADNTCDIGAYEGESERIFANGFDT